MRLQVSAAPQGGWAGNLKLQHAGDSRSGHHATHFIKDEYNFPRQSDSPLQNPTSSIRAWVNVVLSTRGVEFLSFLPFIVLT